MDTALLEVLLAKQAITEKLFEYCRAMDRLDAALGKGCFHADAKVDYGEHVFRGSGHAFVEMCMEAHQRFHAHSHQVTNILIRLDGPERARSECYVDATLRRTDDAGQAHDMRNLGRYVDHWEKRDGSWRIARRIYLLDFDQSGPNAGLFPTTGLRDRADPSYFGA